MSANRPGLHVAAAGMPFCTICVAAAMLAAVPRGEGVHVSFSLDGPVGDATGDNQDNDVITAANNLPRPWTDYFPPVADSIPMWTPLPVLVEACFSLIKRYLPLGATKRSNSLPADTNKRFRQEQLDLSEHVALQREAKSAPPPRYFEDPHLRQFLHVGGVNVKHDRFSAMLLALGGGIGF